MNLLHLNISDKRNKRKTQVPRIPAAPFPWRLGGTLGRLLHVDGTFDRGRRWGDRLCTAARQVVEHCKICVGPLTPVLNSDQEMWAETRRVSTWQVGFTVQGVSEKTRSTLNPVQVASWRREDSCRNTCYEGAWPGGRWLSPFAKAYCASAWWFV